MTPIDARKYLVSLLQNFAKNETSVQGGGVALTSFWSWGRSPQWSWQTANPGSVDRSALIPASNCQLCRQCFAHVRRILEFQMPTLEVSRRSITGKLSLSGISRST